MKRLRILLSLFSVLMLANTYAAETEPNNTKAQANTLALNGNNTGAINVSGDEDWWKITTNADGKLNVSITISNSVNLRCYIYDNDGITLLENGYTSTTAVISKDGLAAGTYYIKLIAYYSGQLPAYTVSNTLTVPAQANDVEPNDVKTQAVVLPLNNSKTGHINYYYKNKKDTLDWYKVTTNADGRLRLTMSSANGQNIWAYLFDNDGTTQLAAGYTSGTSAVVNKDGLAAGTYYIRIKTYYTSEFAPYTLSDSLFTPVEPNDTEPDSTRAQALTLPLNGSKQGHINYYYNNHKDSVDWYKVTLNGDGRLRLRMKTGNGQNVWAYLFDNDGKTQLAAGYTSGDGFVVNKDGLAAGTYFIRVNTYYTSEWAPYTLYDSLFKATPANDTEPNDSKLQALTLPLNGSATGHTNYYYKLKKDTTDWYKLTTLKDGMITIGIQSYNGQYVWAYLFDNDGTTVLASAYTAGSTSYSFDGLKAGTYYVRINTYYNGDWAPYKLSNTVSYYDAYAVDSTEPNNYFKQAKTMLSNKTTTGHVNFYYNGQSDAVDYHKLYYSGTGNLKLVFNQENRMKYGSPTYTWFQVFKDTTASPIYSNYFNSTTSGDINLTGLARAYYYIKVFTYYNGKGEHFSSYSITNTYAQANKAAITVTAIDSTPTCDSTNSISYKLSKSHSPYRVQLYRFGIAYGDLVTVAGTTITFDSLPSGLYYATVFGDGATGTQYGQSLATIFMPIPLNPNTAGIKAKQATLKWTKVTCADYYRIQYHVSGNPTWDSVNTVGNVAQYVLKNLAASTAYEWQVAAVDTLNGMVAISAYSPVKTFTTLSSFTGAIAENDESADNANINGKIAGVFTVSPNPVNNVFTIRYNGAAKDKLSAILYNANGKALWNSGPISAESLNGKQVFVNRFESGLYFLKITDAEGRIKDVIKVSIIK